MCPNQTPHNHLEHVQHGFIDDIGATLSGKQPCTQDLMEVLPIQEDTPAPLNLKDGLPLYTGQLIFL